jgi:hypothetical protein
MSCLAEQRYPNFGESAWKTADVVGATGRSPANVFPKSDTGKRPLAPTISFSCIIVWAKEPVRDCSQLENENRHPKSCRFTHDQLLKGIQHLYTDPLRKGRKLKFCVGFGEFLFSYCIFEVKSQIRSFGKHSKHPQSGWLTTQAAIVGSSKRRFP